MATKKSSEENKKTTKKTATKASAKTTKETKSVKSEKAPSKTIKIETVEEIKTQDIKQEDNNLIYELQNEFEKFKAELNIMKQFNNKDKNPNDKVFVEIEKIKEQIYILEEKIEELEYRLENSEDY